MQHKPIWKLSIKYLDHFEVWSMNLLPMSQYANQIGELNPICILREKLAAQMRHISIFKWNFLCKHCQLKCFSFCTWGASSHHINRDLEGLDRIKNIQRESNFICDATKPLWKVHRVQTSLSFSIFFTEEKSYFDVCQFVFV